MFLSTRVAATWRAGDTSMLQAWKTMTAAAARMVHRLQPGDRDADVGRLSDEWLRQFEIESGKHRNDLW